VRARIYSFYSQNMKTAKELAAIVASTKVDRDKYNSVSDHVLHAQRFTIDGNTFVLATFNVTNPDYMCYMNGVPAAGKALPSWFSGLDNQFGLENRPLSDPNRQEERETIIKNSLQDLINSEENIVLCIQECWDDLYEHLVNEPGGIFGSRDSSSRSFRAIIWTCNFQAYLIQPTVLKIFETITIHNVHLPFKTEDVHTALKDIIRLSDGLTFIVGDFNVQTQVISENTLKEGSTDTLQELVQKLNASTILFAVHPNGWSNWNVRKNCADRENNRDHFDNIMLVCENPPNIEIKPVQWDIIMN